MKTALAILLAIGAFAGAHAARDAAKHLRDGTEKAPPFAPSPSSARYLSIGYNELAADIFFVRLRGYVGGGSQSAHGVADLCEAIVELDPRFERIYEFCGLSMTLGAQDVDNTIYLRAIALLERGCREFPSYWRLPNLAGQIYTQDLKTDDPVQRREWDEKGMLLVESAIRKPGAPADLALWAAVMRTQYGQHQRTVEGLREVLLLTSDTAARGKLIKRLAELEQQDADAIAGELFEARSQFQRHWLDERPVLPPTWFIILGPRLHPGFSLADLATGGRDLLSYTALSRHEPVPD